MEFLHHPILDDPKILMIAGGSFLLLIAVVFWVRFLVKRKFENQLQQVVKNIAVEYKRNIYIPDGLDGTAFIHYMILSHYGIIVLNVQNYPGILFGGENTDLWTQISHRKSYKFKNPLHYSSICVQSVKQIVPNAPVFGQVIFTHAGEFPKGKPEGVCLTFELLKFIESKTRMDVISDSLWKDWEKLKSSSTKIL